MTHLSGQSVLVTGANRGLGREFVTQLLERNVATVYAAARDPQSVGSADPRVEAIRLDVSDAESVREAREVAGDVSIVVNNAGISMAASVIAPDPTDLRRELEVNLFGPLAVTAAFADSVRERSGAVVNIASALSWLALGGSYSVAKAGLWSATDAMRLELQPDDVQVLGVYMGYVDTDMTRGVTAPKSSAADIVRQVLDALEAGEHEVLADETARSIRSGLHLPADQRYPQLRTGADEESA